jgi:hypothetical protein
MYTVLYLKKPTTVSMLWHLVIQRNIQSTGNIPISLRERTLNIFWFCTVNQGFESHFSKKRLCKKKKVRSGLKFYRTTFWKSEPEICNSKPCIAHQTKALKSFQLFFLCSYSLQFLLRKNFLHNICIIQTEWREQRNYSEMTTIEQKKTT